MNKRVSQLGDLSPDHGRERSLHGKRILDPGMGFVSDWENRYTASMYPFTIGTTARRLLPANPLRTYLLVQNTSAATNLFINFGQNPTVTASITIFPGGNYELIGGSNGGAFCPQDDVYLLGAAAGVTGTAVEGIWTPQSRSL